MYLLYFIISMISKDHTVIQAPLERGTSCRKVSCIGTMKSKRSLEMEIISAIYKRKRETG